MKICVVTLYLLSIFAFFDYELDVLELQCWIIVYLFDYLFLPILEKLLEYHTSLFFVDFDQLF